MITLSELNKSIYWAIKNRYFNEFDKGLDLTDSILVNFKGYTYPNEDDSNLEVLFSRYDKLELEDADGCYYKKSVAKGMPYGYVSHKLPYGNLKVEALLVVNYDVLSYSQWDRTRSRFGEELQAAIDKAYNSHTIPERTSGGIADWIMSYFKHESEEDD